MTCHASKMHCSLVIEVLKKNNVKKKMNKPRGIMQSLYTCIHECIVTYGIVQLIHCSEELFDEEKKKTIKKPTNHKYPKNHRRIMDLATLVLFIVIIKTYFKYFFLWKIFVPLHEYI